MATGMRNGRTLVARVSLVMPSLLPSNATLWIPKKQRHSKLLPQMHGWDQVQVLSPERWEITVKRHLSHFHCFLKDIWILKSSRSRKHSTYANDSRFSYQFKGNTIITFRHWWKKLKQVYPICHLKCCGKCYNVRLIQTVTKRRGTKLWISA